MKELIILITYDEDQISIEEIGDHINHFITSSPANIKAQYYEES